MIEEFAPAIVESQIRLDIPDAIAFFRHYWPLYDETGRDGLVVQHSHTNGHESYYTFRTTHDKSKPDIWCEMTKTGEGEYPDVFKTIYYYDYKDAEWHVGGRTWTRTTRMPDYFFQNK